ncbi:MAG: ComEC family competence protein [Boseongicola sp.]|nr:ComEC family competence protein [Boseongicola sp.]
MFQLSSLIDRQRGHLFPWSPVLLGIGIGFYFMIKSEPTIPQLAGLLSAALVGAFLARRLDPALQVCIAALILIALGFTLAAWRAHSVAAPTLGFRYYGPIEGRILNIDRSQSDAVRLTLDQVVLYNMRPHRTPDKVRVSLHGDQSHHNHEIGQTVILTGHLSPPSGPVEPGGFDFQRMAWFKGIGAVGYTRTPVLLWKGEGARSLGLSITRLRLDISRAVQSLLPGRAGAFAAAITTGDRSGMDNATLEDLRASNLAHLLAISGLHMGLLTGFVFAAIRYGLALVPSIALRAPVKKIGAAGALLAGAAYLALSGGNVATERAFIMVATMLLAVLADRRAITLRAVALAALIVLSLRPETLLGPGFQMSFSATIALVAAFGWMRDADWSNSRWPWLLRVVSGVALSSAVAGLATAPIAAAHFNQIPHFGLLANILSVPVMATIIMPAAVLAAVLWPFGLHWIGLKLMEPAINLILIVADKVAHLPGALSHIWSPSPAVLPLVALGFLWLVLWQGRARFAGLAAMVVSGFIWNATPRPDLIVNETGSLIGVMTAEGRHISKSRGNSFAAMSWLENDGDPVEQARAFGRRGFETDERRHVVELHNTVIFHATGKIAGAKAIADCADADYVVVNIKVPKAEETECTIFGLESLRRTGALALYHQGDTLRLETARAKQGARLWSQ